MIWKGCFIGFLFLSILGVRVEAQNYQPILPGSEIAFSDSAGILYCIHIDSITVSGNDTIFYNYKYVDVDSLGLIIGNSSVSAKDTSWLGLKVIKAANDEYLFFNYHMDTLRIKYSELVSAKWNAMNLGNGQFLECEITSHDTVDIFGIVDSVKTLTFTARDSFNNLIAHPVNGKSIKLSKQFGLTVAIDFMSFPNQFITYNISGIYKGGKGKYAIKQRDIFNYDVGDEFHYRYFISYMNAPTYVSYTKYTKRVVQSKTVLVSTIVYNDSIFSVKRHKTNLFVDSFVFDQYLDTTIIDLSAKTRFDLLPLEAYDGGLLGGYVTITDSSYFRGRTIMNFNPVNGFYYGGDRLIIDDTPLWGTTDVFVEGLGRVYFTFGFVVGGFYFNPSVGDSLVYYKKGQETYGTPIDFDQFTSTENVSLPCETMSEVIPNPSTFYSTIFFCNSQMEPFELIVFDAVGKKILSEYNIQSDRVQLNQHHLKNGLYFYKLRNSRNNDTFHGKFIIQY